MKQYILYPKGHKDKVGGIVEDRQSLIMEYRPIIVEAIKEYVATKKAFYDDILDVVEVLTPMTRLECLEVLKAIDQEWHPNKFSSADSIPTEIIKKKGK